MNSDVLNRYNTEDEACRAGFVASVSDPASVAVTVIGHRLLAQGLTPARV